MGHKSQLKAQRRAQKIAQVQRERDIAEVFGVETMWDRMLRYASAQPKIVWDDKYEDWEHNMDDVFMLVNDWQPIPIDGTKIYECEDIFDNAEDTLLNMSFKLPFDDIFVQFHNVELTWSDAGTTGDFGVWLHQMPEDEERGLEGIAPHVYYSDLGEGAFGVIWRENNKIEIDSKFRRHSYEVERLLNLTYQALRVVTLLNTSNIELIDQPPNPRLSAISEREFGRPLTTYKVLKVNTGHKEYYGRDKDTGLRDFDPRRMHVVRGHHAEYGTNGRKLLFGKYQRKIWIPAHVRGNEELGIVVKDYEVVATSD